MSGIRTALAHPVVASALGIVASPAASAAADGPMPARDFFRHPERSQFRISPDGTTLGFKQPYERRMYIYMQSIAGGEPKRPIKETARDIPDPLWKGPGRLVYQAMQRFLAKYRGKG